MYQELEQKIKSMSAKQIILAMVDSLQNPVMRVDMNEYGRKVSGICYGCAAANTICKLGNLDPKKEFVSVDERRECVNRNYEIESDFVSSFESAINFLRSNHIPAYNRRAKASGFAEIVEKKLLDLPAITNYNYKENEVLAAYVELANYQP